MTPRETCASITAVITKMIQAGLSDEQRYPVLRSVGARQVEVGIEGAPDMSATLKSIPYDQAFVELEKAGAFNVKMIDGALVQFAYTFQRNKISAHRLAFFPAPNLEAYEDARSLYDDDEIFADIVGRYLVRFPIRFDFSSSDGDHVEVDHPRSHLTLGQYKNCRIPVNGPLTPVRFTKFIIRNFYHSTIPRIQFDARSERHAFADTITVAERRIAHLVG
jgi:hypothetical protein